MRRSVTLPLLFSALVSLAGCKTPCRQLSEELCNCVQQYQRTDCVTLAAQRERSVEPSDEDQAFCESKLDSCKLQKVEDENQTPSNGELACAALQEEVGKEACGLTR
jgi:phage-related protein